MPTVDQITKFVKDNELVLGLVVTAIIATMPENLPSVRMFPQWVWTWFHNASKTFLNFRYGKDVDTKPTESTNKPEQLNG